MIVKISENYFNEKKYTIDTILNQFLGLQYRLEIHKDQDYYICLPNGNEIIIKDYFFSKFSEDAGYLFKRSIPESVKYINNRFLCESDIPVIFGDASLTYNSNTLVCGLDIFASSFFMLSRWEEYVDDFRDEHCRYPAVASLAFRSKFLSRPVVNEYTEMLWNMLEFIGIEQERKQRKYHFVVTHDVDVPLHAPGKLQYLRNCASIILKKRHFKMGLINLLKFFAFNRFESDIHNNFDYLMNISERAGLKSNFFFMTDGKHEYDYYYNPDSKFIKKIISNILNRNHIVGFHPSYNTYNNYKLWKSELDLFKNIISSNPQYGRQHFLRFEIPTTWQIWEDYGIKVDLTLGYPDVEGFRCGTCYEFHPFNIITRKKMNLIEMPLIIMDNTLIAYRNLTRAEMLDIVKKYVMTIRKYNGNFVFLWHNHLLQGNYEIYENIIKCAKG